MIVVIDYFAEQIFSAISRFSLTAGEGRLSLSILAGGATAVVGGFAGSWLSENFAAKRRKLEALTNQKASAFHLQLQLLGMYSDLCQFREHLGQSRVAFRGRGQDPSPFRAQYHPAFSGEQTLVHFRVDDLQALAAYGGDNLLNLVADIDRRFNAIAAALNQYRAAWLELGAQIEGDIHGEKVVMELDRAGLRTFGPKFALLSKLLHDLDPMVEDLVADSYRALVAVYHARVKAHGLRKQFEGIAPTGLVERIDPDLGAEPPKARKLF